MSATITKKECIERLSAAKQEVEMYKLRCKTAVEYADKATSEMDTLKNKLAKSEAYVEQGRAMIEAIMERWYEYDA